VTCRWEGEDLNPPDREKALIERIPHAWVRSFARAGLAVAGLIVWSMMSAGIRYLIPYMDIPFLRTSVSGFVALAFLLPLWRLVPLTSGRTGAFGIASVANTAVVLFLPFLVVALMTGVTTGNAGATWLIYAGALLLLAAAEEFVCRGYLLDVLSVGGNRVTGLILSSCVFAYFHTDNSYASVPGVVNILLAGIVFGMLRFTTGGLVFPTLLHWLWNLGTGMVFGWSVSGFTVFPSIFAPAGPLPWGGFGPEESPLMTVATLGCVAVLWKTLRSSYDKDLPGIGVRS